MRNSEKTQKGGCISKPHFLSKQKSQNHKLNTNISLTQRNPFQKSQKTHTPYFVWLSVFFPKSSAFWALESLSLAYGVCEPEPSSGFLLIRSQKYGPPRPQFYATAGSFCGQHDDGLYGAQQRRVAGGGSEQEDPETVHDYQVQGELDGPGARQVSRSSPAVSSAPSIFFVGSVLPFDFSVGNSASSAWFLKKVWIFSTEKKNYLFN